MGHLLIREVSGDKKHRKEGKAAKKNPRQTGYGVLLQNSLGLPGAKGMRGRVNENPKKQFPREPSRSGKTGALEGKNDWSCMVGKRGNLQTHLWGTFVLNDHP